MNELQIKQSIERIIGMEDILTNVANALDELEAAVKKYKEIQPEIKKLEEYFISAERKTDLALEEEGLLPKNLKRGVLSEDDIDDLLDRNKEDGQLFS